MLASKRIQYIDTAKFLGMIFVVFFHGYKEGKPLWFIHSFIIPMFFFLNGMTLKLEGISFGDFLVKKLKGYMLPCFGLGILGVLLDALVRAKFFNLPLDDAFFFRGFNSSINQMRFLAIWFLSALFFCDIFIFGLYHKLKKNLWLTGLGALAILGIGIFYNIHYKAVMVWNLDVALFGVIFTYCGLLFTSKPLSALYQRLTGNRYIPLLVGSALLVGTYFLSIYIMESTQIHLNMFGSKYGTYYLTLPCALLGSIGFTLVCRSITNVAFAYPVKFNLVLLAIHQGFVFPIFKHMIAKPWWNRISHLPAESPDYIQFVVTLTLFSAAVAALMYGIIIVTPFSWIVNKPRYPLFEKIYSTLSKIIKARS